MEPSKEDLAAAIEAPCECGCARCDQGSHCGDSRKGCRWFYNRRTKRPVSR